MFKKLSITSTLLRYADFLNGIENEQDLCPVIMIEWDKQQQLGSTSTASEYEQKFIYVSVFNLKIWRKER